MPPHSPRPTDITYTFAARLLASQEMVDAFRSHSMRRRVEGRAAQLWFWVTAFVELLPSGIRVRLESSGLRYDMNRSR